MKFIYLVTLAAIIVSCNSIDNKDSKTLKESNTTRYQIDTVYVIRNSMVTPSNAYNDLFLDSNAVEQYITANKTAQEDAERLRSFYNYRNLEYAWFSSAGPNEQLKGWRNLLKQAGNRDAEKLAAKMDSLSLNDSLHVNRNDSAIQKLELSLTEQFLKYNAGHRNELVVNRSAELSIPARREQLQDMTDTMLHVTVNGMGKAAANFKVLQEKLRQYDSVWKKGGWKTITLRTKGWKKGISFPEVTTLKKRLQQSGDYSYADTGRTYNDTLELAIKNFQQRYGMTPTGTVTDSLLMNLNIPVEERMKQLIINMQRMYWMPEMPIKYIMVNIPELKLKVLENNAPVLTMPVAVGRQVSRTLTLNSYIDKIVFSPSWNVPSGIAQKEIAPKMNADKNYLKKKHIEVVSKKGDLVSLKQLPGADNDLGGVKFTLPNAEDIYLHDTRDKTLFAKNNRAVTHGCIRLYDAEALAGYLLQHDDAWSPEKIHAAMNSGVEKTVPLKDKIPVAISYLTAWADEAGQLHVGEDVYGLDAAAYQAVFAGASTAAATDILHRSSR